MGAILLGWVSQHAGYQVLFTASAVSVGMSLLLFLFFVKRYSGSSNQLLEAKE